MIRIALAIAVMVTVGCGGVAIAKPAVPAWRDTQPWTTRIATVIVGDVTLSAELADTPALRARGLGYRDSLEPGTAMLFKFSDSSGHSFWMKGMRFCLDIVWIDENRIVGAEEKVCPMPGTPDGELPKYSSPEPVNYVLEVPAGWMELNGFGPGTEVLITLPPDPEP